MSIRDTKNDIFKKKSRFKMLPQVKNKGKTAFSFEEEDFDIIDSSEDSSDEHSSNSDDYFDPAWIEESWEVKTRRKYKEIVKKDKLKGHINNTKENLTTENNSNTTNTTNNNNNNNNMNQHISLNSQGSDSVLTGSETEEKSSSESELSPYDISLESSKSKYKTTIRKVHHNNNINKSDNDQILNNDAKSPSIKKIEYKRKEKKKRFGHCRGKSNDKIMIERRKVMTNGKYNTMLDLKIEKKRDMVNISSNSSKNNNKNVVKQEKKKKKDIVIPILKFQEADKGYTSKKERMIYHSPRERRSSTYKQLSGRGKYSHGTLQLSHRNNERGLLYHHHHHPKELKERRSHYYSPRESRKKRLPMSDSPRSHHYSPRESRKKILPILDLPRYNNSRGRSGTLEVKYKKEHNTHLRKSFNEKKQSYDSEIIFSDHILRRSNSEGSLKTFSMTRKHREKYSKELKRRNEKHRNNTRRKDMK